VPIDNDGSALYGALKLPRVLQNLLFPWTRWKAASDKRKLQLIKYSQPDESSVAIESIFKIPGGKTPLELKYTITKEGSVEVDYLFTPRFNLLRAGLQVEIPGDFKNVSWFGRGPHESMMDRKTGYPVGVYSLQIEDFIHNYVRPQENANRSDVRWARLKDDQGNGLEIQTVGNSLFNFSAWPYTMVDLESSKHIHELPRRENITLNIDYGQKGVGDLTSAILGMPEEAQLLGGDPCRFRFIIKPILH
jgi:beta-galactosidase